MGIFLNFILIIIHKCSKFLKFFFEKSFKLFLDKENSFAILNSDFLLLPAEVDLILKKQSYKRNAFLTLCFSGFEIVFIIDRNNNSLYTSFYGIAQNFLLLKDLSKAFFLTFTNAGIETRFWFFRQAFINYFNSLSLLVKKTGTKAKTKANITILNINPKIKVQKRPKK